MPLYLSIDPGLSHTGFAISDSTHLAKPLTTVNSKELNQTLIHILKLIEKHKPDHLIIGQPSFGPIHALAQDIFNSLKPQFKGKIHLFSEDLSSKKAVKKLVQSGGSRYARRRKNHSAAAAVILQDFLDSIPAS